MQQDDLLALYFARSEDAIAATRAQYGAYCTRIAGNILSRREDAEECVADAYLRVWERIPPERPLHFAAWLGAVVRNLALDRFRRERAQKRDCGLTLLLDELSECLPAADSTERALESRALAACLDRFLAGLRAEDRILFLRRYWYGEALAALAKEEGVPQNRLAQRMRRLRLALKESLEKEGFSL